MKASYDLNQSNFGLGRTAEQLKMHGLESLGGTYTQKSILGRKRA